MPSSNQQAARRMPENHRLAEGDLLPLARALSTAWLERLRRSKPSPKARARSTMDSAAGATSAALAQALSLVGQTQALEGVVQGSGSASQHQHGWAHPGPAGALEAGQAGGVLLWAGQTIPAHHTMARHTMGVPEVVSLIFGRTITTVCHDWGEVVTR